jgi:hypothetical protein
MEWSMTQASNTGADVRAAILNPLTGWRHELVVVDEWGGATIAVREPTVDDRLFWLEPLNEAAGVAQGDAEDDVRAKYAAISASGHRRADARLFARTVFHNAHGGWRRVFGDFDVDEICTAFGRLHQRLVVKAVELGNLDVDPVDHGKNVSAEPPACAS